MRPISKDKRELIVEAKKRNEKAKDIAKWLQVGVRTIASIWKRHRETGDSSPIPYTGRKSSVSEETIEQIKATIKETPDITLAEMIEKLNLPIKKSQLSRLINRLGLSYKKKHFTRKNS